MKLEEGMFLVLQFGRPHKKQAWGLDLSFVAKEVGHHFNLSKSQVKRLINQGGIKIGVHKYEK